MDRRITILHNPLQNGDALKFYASNPVNITTISTPLGIVNVNNIYRTANLNRQRNNDILSVGSNTDNGLSLTPGSTQHIKNIENYDENFNRNKDLYDKPNYKVENNGLYPGTFGFVNSDEIRERQYALQPDISSSKLPKGAHETPSRVDVSINQNESDEVNLPRSSSTMQSFGSQATPGARGRHGESYDSDSDSELEDEMLSLISRINDGR